MPDSPDSSDAVVLVPPLRGRLADRSLLRWLSQGLLEQLDAPVDALAQVLRTLGREIPGDGLAALRMWGQTGERPATWVAAAEAVYMEPRLDRLFLHVLGPDDVTGAELRMPFRCVAGQPGRRRRARLCAARRLWLCPLGAADGNAGQTRGIAGRTEPGRRVTAGGNGRGDAEPDFGD